MLYLVVVQGHTRGQQQTAHIQIVAALVNAQQSQPNALHHNCSWWWQIYGVCVCVLLNMFVDVWLQQHQMLNHLWHQLLTYAARRWQSHHFEWWGADCWVATQVTHTW